MEAIRSFLGNRLAGNPFTCSNKKPFSTSSKLLGARTLLGAPGLTTRSILTTSNKKLLGLLVLSFFESLNLVPGVERACRVWS